MPTTDAAIALGANLGDRERSIESAIAQIDSLEGTSVLARSSLIETDPVGPIDQPNYLNGALTLRTSLDAPGLLSALFAIERSMGRDRSSEERWGPRVIDLDLILFGDHVINSPDLTIPHPRMHERRFVLDPLSEIASGWAHPRIGKTVGELREALAQGGAP